MHMSDETVWDRLERPDVDERLDKARAIRDQMGIYGEGGQASREFYEISPTHTQGVIEWCFGMVWSQPHLDLKTKEICVMCTMAAQDLPEELAWHARSALNLGLTREEIIAVIVQCSPYIGLPKTNHALRAVARMFKELESGPSS
jgi:4-carboxymuconolactone decarboxylase